MGSMIFRVQCGDRHVNRSEVNSSLPESVWRKLSVAPLKKQECETEIKKLALHPDRIARPIKHHRFVIFGPM
jgi:hypothetical protein